MLRASLTSAAHALHLAAYRQITHAAYRHPPPALLFFIAAYRLPPPTAAYRQIPLAAYRQTNLAAYRRLTQSHIYFAAYRHRCSTPHAAHRPRASVFKGHPWRGKD
jgi:hypothetical protein